MEMNEKKRRKKTLKKKTLQQSRQTAKGIPQTYTYIHRIKYGLMS